MKKTKKEKNFSKKAEMLKRDTGAWMMLLPSAFCIFFFVLFPQMRSLLWSFFSMKGFQIQEFAGLQNYKLVVTDVLFLKTLLNTVAYVIWSLIIGLVIPFVIAVCMNEITRFSKTVRTLVYLPSIMPAVAVSTLWYYIYYPDGTGLLNSLLVKLNMEPYIWLQDSRFTILYIIISMTWAGAGSTAIYYFAGLQGINRELYEAAIIDGAGFFKRHLTVTVPQMSGMIVLFAIRQCISVFSIVDQPMQMTDGGPNNASLSLGLLEYRYAFTNYRPDMGIALGVIMIIMMSVFAVIYFQMDKKLEKNQM